MNIKTNSLFGKYYGWMFHNIYSENFCAIFWNVLFSILLLPVNIITYIKWWRGYCWEDRSLFVRFLWGGLLWFITFFFSVMGLGVIDKYFGDFWKHLPFLWMFLLGLGTITLVIGVILIGCAIVVLAIVGIKEGGQWVYEKATDKSVPAREPNKLEVIAATIKQKYCAKVNWIEE